MSAQETINVTVAITHDQRIDLRIEGFFATINGSCPRSLDAEAFKSWLDSIKSKIDAALKQSREQEIREFAEYVRLYQKFGPLPSTINHEITAAETETAIAGNRAIVDPT